MSRISEADLVQDFERMGICAGDTILLRASVGAIGRISGGANSFISALLTVVGSDGTIVSLAYTSGSFLKKPKKHEAFDLKKRSYAGALPNAMLEYEGSFRSRHPMCSCVAIGRRAEEILKNHDENSPAYEPIRNIIELNGKCMLIGCVASSPGFTTAHLAEADLGLLSLSILSQFRTTYYKDRSGEIKLFRRKDPGLCSNSFYKFYALYVKNEILTTGYVGKAYSIIAPAKECYDLELATLKQDHKFNICDSKLCFTCNAGRWDRVHRAPVYFLRLVAKKLKARMSIG